MENKKTKRVLIPITVIVALFAIVTIAFNIYVSGYYRADENAFDYIDSPAVNVNVEYVDNTVVFSPESGDGTGLIFYPGGLVEAEAYAPLLEKLAENGVTCILARMPYNLAVFDSKAADGIQEDYPEITNWYIGGHSLGGAMAANYVANHTDEYDGLVLLASYSTEDLSATGLKTLLVRGSEDGVLNMESYNDDLPNLPSDYTEVIIDGGCHAYFGDYGAQDGDGTPTISVFEQTNQTVEAILKMINE